MPRPRLVPTAILFALALLGPALPAHPAPLSVQDLDRLQAVAEREKLPIRTIRLGGPAQLTLFSEEPVSREDFIRRASLLAYYVFNQLPSKVEGIAFENTGSDWRQTCTIKAVDHALYLKDGITKIEYERRLAYQQIATRPVASPAMTLAAVRPTGLGPSPAPAMAPPTPAPSPTDVRPSPSPIAAKPSPVPTPMAVRPTASPVPVKPSPSPLEVRPAASPTPLKPSPSPASGRTALVKAPGLEPLVGISYGLGLGGGRYDAYVLEYGHPLLATLDLRPSLQILSPFSPVNFFTESGRMLEGLSLACDLLGTTRQRPNAQGFSFEGGLGARVGAWTGADSNGVWPALHMRVGLRWQALSLGMRYPLFHREGDPTGGWEATIGFGLPLSNMVGQ